MGSHSSGGQKSKIKVLARPHSLKVPGESPLSLPASGDIRCCLALETHHSSLCLFFTWLSSCVSVRLESFSASLMKTTGAGFRAHPKSKMIPYLI